MRLADCTRCGLPIRIMVTGQPCLCGAPTGEPYEADGIYLPVLEERCDKCEGSGAVIENRVLEAWQKRHPWILPGRSPVRYDAKRKFWVADPEPTNEPEEVRCSDCMGIGTIATPAGQAILALVMRRMHQHSRDQYRYIGKRGGAGLPTKP